ncbi:hypothetical protein AYI68_g6341, partial [Smittium mucronatum]
MGDNVLCGSQAIYLKSMISLPKESFENPKFLVPAWQ